MTAKTTADIAIIGAGAAGLMAGIWAGRANPNRSIVILDGAQKLGAKILVAGGGRCNVTHHTVSADAYAGSSRNAIKKVLRRFDVPETIGFFQEIGVHLKQEETGKLFPTTDSARTVLDALVREACRVGCTLHHPARVETIGFDQGKYVVRGAWGEIIADKLVLATGGKSLPKSGSDGWGYAISEQFGHTLTPKIFPSLVPLTLPKTDFLKSLSGIATPATLTLTVPNGKRAESFTGAVLCTHFGLSGPAVLDISRYLLADTSQNLRINWLPDSEPAVFEKNLLNLGKRHPRTYLRELLPNRLADALVDEAGIEAYDMTKVQRKKLVALVTDHVLPIAGDRGWNYAEVTAGGVPLSQINLKSMQSRLQEGLYFCGEICDVDGRIGGFNFQWAWASGYVVGQSV